MARAGAECGGSAPTGRPRRLTLDVHTTTGTTFALTADARSSVDHLKKLVSRRLKVPKERICLLHRERQLRDGTLEDNGLIDGSRIILLPSVETGLLTQRPENSVMQALESLNDSQVNDFLSGKSPLNLTMRLGDHMMLIQLQLSSFPGGGVTSTSGSKSRNSSMTHRSPAKTTTPIKSNEPLLKAQKPTIILGKSTNETKSSSASPSCAPSTSESTSHSTVDTSDIKMEPSETPNVDDFKPFLCKQDIETLQDAFEIFKSLAEMREDLTKDSDDSNCESNKVSNSGTTKYAYCNENSSNASDFEEQSPIKSLSNLVSSPLKSSLTPSYPSISTPAVDNSSNTLQKEDKPPPLKYVPLPSSLKNNLINKLVEDQKDVKEGKNDPQPECPVITDPIAANLTSCLCSSLNSHYNCTSNNHSLDNISKSLATEKNLRKDDNVIANSKDEGNDAWNTSDSATDKKSENHNDHSLEWSSKGIKNKGFDKTSCESLGEQPPKQLKNKRLHYLLHKTSKPGSQSIQNKPKAFMQSLVNKHIKKRIQQSANSSNSELHDLSQPSTSKSDPPQNICSEDNFENVDESLNSPMDDYEEMESTSTFNSTLDPASKLDSSPISNTNSLVEASKNLTQTLKKLSKEVLTNKVDLTNEETLRPKIGQGAVIESMKHHGKGIYSGTFSGTLNPALQDRFGRPKRDISTIIHILNDLLCATPPQYRRGARITFEPTHTQASVHHRQREFRSTSNNCAAEQNGSDECGCNKCSNTLNMCPYGECNGHYTSPQPSSDTMLTPLDICTCKRMETEENSSSMEICTCTSESSCSSLSVKKCHVCDKQKDGNYDNNIGKTCRKCNSASTLALDNSKTKCKLDQLRLVMQQKKQRREARKMKSAPYPSSSSNNVNISQSDQSNVITEEIETVA